MNILIKELLLTNEKVSDNEEEQEFCLSGEGADLSWGRWNGHDSSL